MERWDFVLKAVVTGAEHLSWGVEWAMLRNLTKREQALLFECVTKNLEPVMVVHACYPGTWEMEPRAQVKASFVIRGA